MNRESVTFRAAKSVMISQTTRGVRSQQTMSLWDGRPFGQNKESRQVSERHAIREALTDKYGRAILDPLFKSPLIDRWTVDRVFSTPRVQSWIEKEGEI